MFNRKRAINPQREFIARSAAELVPHVGDRIEWVSPLIGRFALLNLDIESRKIFSPPYYELRVGLRINPEIDRFPHELYMFHKGGNILGVVNNLPQAQFSEASATEFMASTKFQIDNGLTAPNQEDYDKLENYLKNGKLDKV